MKGLNTDGVTIEMSRTETKEEDTEKRFITHTILSQKRRDRCDERQRTRVNEVPKFYINTLLLKVYT